MSRPKNEENFRLFKRKLDKRELFYARFLDEETLPQGLDTTNSYAPLQLTGFLCDFTDFGASSEESKGRGEKPKTGKYPADTYLREA
jgi:hypothetical protein